jgi:hypothetical protein
MTSCCSAPWEPREAERPPVAPRPTPGCGPVLLTCAAALSPAAPRPARPQVLLLPLSLPVGQRRCLAARCSALCAAGWRLRLSHEPAAHSGRATACSPPWSRKPAIGASHAVRVVAACMAATLAATAALCRWDSAAASRVSGGRQRLHSVVHSLLSNCCLLAALTAAASRPSCQWVGCLHGAPPGQQVLVREGEAVLHSTAGKGTEGLSSRGCCTGRRPGPLRWVAAAGCR